MSLALTNSSRMFTISAPNTRYITCRVLTQKSLKARAINLQQMPTTIQPTIHLDVDKVPIERDIYDSYIANTLDFKNVILIGYIAISSCTKHLFSDNEKRDLTAIKEAYDKIIQDLKNNFTERAELISSKIIAEKDKEVELLQQKISTLQEHIETVLARATAEKERELAVIRERNLRDLQSSQASLLQLSEEKEREIIRLKQQVDALNNNMELIVSRAIVDKENEILTQTERRLNEQNNKDLHLNQELAIYKERFHGSEKRIQELESELFKSRQQTQESMQQFFKTAHNEEILALQEQIAVLKGSNFSKGIIGEQTVRQVLQDNFTKCDIVDKSGSAAESDIHVVYPNGDIIAVECKNKTQITFQDVDKSMRDISYLESKYGEKFIGYVFISLRSINIPKKGNCHLEIINDRIPVYWYGQQENTQYTAGYVDYCKAILAISKYISNLRAKFLNSDVERTNYKKSLDDMINVFRTTLEKLNANQKAIATIIQSAKSVQECNNQTLQLLNDHIVAHNLNITNHSEFVCPHCGRVFNRKASLSRHMSKCTGAVSQ
jgi:hypothetical protein